MCSAIEMEEQPRSESRRQQSFAGGQGESVKDGSERLKQWKRGKYAVAVTGRGIERDIKATN